jgi:hypothetical protein
MFGTEKSSRIIECHHHSRTYTGKDFGQFFTLTENFGSTTHTVY